MDQREPLVFVSYEDAEARTYATEAKRIFESFSYKTWVWHHDHGPSGYLHEEMDQNIRRCDYFLYICTEGSDHSDGQRYERNMACKRQKEIIILAFDRKFISSMLDPYIYYLVSGDNFGATCGRVAEELAGQQRLRDRVAQYRKEDEAVESAR